MTPNCNTPARTNLHLQGSHGDECSPLQGIHPISSMYAGTHSHIYQQNTVTSYSTNNNKHVPSQITCQPTNKIYVGQTTNLQQRFQAHQLHPSACKQMRQTTNHSHAISRWTCWASPLTSKLQMPQKSILSAIWMRRVQMATTNYQEAQRPPKPTIF